MSTLDDFKKEWAAATPPPAPKPRVDRADLQAIAQAGSARHVNRAIQYFWASLTLQMMVYALLTHVFIRFWGVAAVQGMCLAGAALYLPFTVVLLRQFQRVARPLPTAAEAGASLQARTQQQHDSLRAFYRFKRGYEYLLIPLSTALGVWLIFRLYVPGGVPQHLTGAGIAYLLSLLCCGWAIRRENRRHFELPLQNLKALLAEFGQ